MVFDLVPLAFVCRLLLCFCFCRLPAGPIHLIASKSHNINMAPTDHTQRRQPGGGANLPPLPSANAAKDEGGEYRTTQK